MKLFSKIIKKITSNSFFCGRSIAILLIFLLSIKQLAIYSTYGGQITGGFISIALLYLGFLGNDLMIMGLVLLLVLINFNTRNKYIKRTTNSINIILILIFFIDIITIFFFQSRLSIFDIYSFFRLSNSKYFFSYLIFSLLFFGGLFVVSFLLSKKFLKKRKDNSNQGIIAVIFLIFTFAITAINIATQNNISIANNILALNIQTLGESSDSEENYPDLTGQKYEEYFTTIKGRNKKPNVILLFAESLSTIDSKRAGGIYNNLPLFDKIQAEGITLTNFIANGCTSETAHIATLQGIEPREYPRIDTNKSYDTYATYLESLPAFMQSQGYKTAFISTVSLDFLNQRSFISGLNYQTVIGDEGFKDEEKYVFDAAPDHALYNKTLELILGNNTNDKPYFITIQNISAHIPYDTPYGKNTEQMLSYVDKNLYTFYQKLKNNGFFDNGILVIVGDHRKMEAINKKEFQKFGLSSKSRIAATIIGKDIKKNSFNDSIIQHTDIHNSLKYFIGDKVKVSKLFNNIFSIKPNRDWGIRYCRFAEKHYVRINQDGTARNIGNKKEDKQIKQYISAYKGFQAERLLGIKGITDYETPHITDADSTGLVLIAHGGGPYNNIISNTIEAANNAQKDGADALELDISYTKDHKNVVLHGPSLQSTTCGIEKTITGFTLEELKKDCPLKNGEQISTLEEFLTQTKDLFNLYFLEIKVYDTKKAKKQTLNAINTVIKLGMEKEVIFISYDKTANYIIGNDKRIRAGRDTFYENGDIISKSPHEFYLTPETLLNKITIEVAKAMKKPYVVYTLNTKESIEKAIGFGVKYIMTDNIPLAKSIIK